MVHYVKVTDCKKIINVAAFFIKLEAVFAHVTC